MAASEPAWDELSVPPVDRRLLAPVIVCVAIFGLLALQVILQGALTRVDHEITLFFASRRQQWLTQLTLAVAAAHETLKLLGVAALLAMWRIWRRDLRSVNLLAVVPVGMLLNVGLKNLIQRPRPTLEEPLVQLSTYSFPSGHAVASTVFYGALCALVFIHARSPAPRWLAALAGVAMVLLVGFSRVYLGAHYLSDVVAGVAVGTLCLLLFLRLVRR
jgi:membrane-associated phospholipid phosphatase